MPKVKDRSRSRASHHVQAERGQSRTGAGPAVFDRGGRGRRPQGGVEVRGRHPTTVMISERPAEVEATVAGGSSATVKSLLRALIHETRVDRRQAIHPVFRVSFGGNHLVDNAVAHRPGRWR